MNAGIVVGKVRDGNGKPVEGATIQLGFVAGQQQYDIGRLSSRPETESDSKGNFTLNFSWEGTDFASFDTAPSTIMVAAYIDHNYKNNNYQTNTTRTNIKGYLARDWKSLSTIIASDPTSSKLDAVEFALDLAKAIKGFSFAPPIKAQAFSTESWLIYGASYIYLNA